MAGSGSASAMLLGGGRSKPKQPGFGLVRERFQKNSMTLIRKWKSKIGLGKKEKGEKEFEPLPVRRIGPFTVLQDRLQQQYYREGKATADAAFNSILRRIFSHVCPHSLDETYEAQEASMIGDGCVLCDTRDLSHCEMVSKRWYWLASGLLYNSIRIDAVHFCEREEYLADRRQQKHNSKDIPGQRLEDLSQTVQRNPNLGQTVRFLKVPYMTREAWTVDLERCASWMPNLQYIDLPDGCYSHDPLYDKLNYTLIRNCPKLRRMKYNGTRSGVAESFESLYARGYWPQLQILEISGIHVDAATFRRVLGRLQLTELSVSDAAWFNDEIFSSAPQQLPEFPSLKKLTIDKVPISINGLDSFFQDALARQTLTHLSVSGTDVEATDLPHLLQAAHNLLALSYVATVSTPLPLDQTHIPKLISTSLRTLNYEILDTDNQPSTLHPPAATYHMYLQSALQNNCLPALTKLYVRDPAFPETLLLKPPAPAFASGSSNNPFAAVSQTLEIYTKGADDLEWIFADVSAPSSDPARRGSLAGRPSSQYTTEPGSLGPQWGAEARRSVIVGNGFGGFLAVPPDDAGGGARPSSSGGGGGAWPSPMNSPMKSAFATPLQSPMSAGFAGLEKPPNRGSWFKGHEKRGSRADLWR